MENLLPSFLAFSTFITFFLFISTILKTKNLKEPSKATNNKTTLPPGPWKLPLIGNLHQLISSKLPHHRLRDLANEYGPLMYLQLGEVPHIVVSSPEFAKEIMKTHDVNFAQRPLLLLAGNYYGKGIVFGVYGDYWRMVKKICTEELLNPKQVQSFRSIRKGELSDFVGDLRSKSGSTVNLSSKLLTMLYGITSRAAFGNKCKDQEVLISIVTEALKIAVGFSAYELFPSQKWLHWIGDIRPKMKKIVDGIDRVLDGIILERRTTPKRDNDGATGCLLDALLNIQEKKKLPFPLDIDNIKAVILDIFVGGSETSSTVIEWAMLEMLKNPKVMEKAQSEVRNVFGKQGNVDEKSLHELGYLKMVIKETLRFHPPGPFIVPREARESCVVAGFHIPAKTRVIISSWAIGRDPKYWDDAERFYPERFVESSVDFKGNSFELVPFGSGRRICPGIGFAIVDIELSLANLLFHFDWKLPEGISHENLDMSESFGMTVRRKEDLCLIPVPYNPATIA